MRETWVKTMEGYGGTRRSAMAVSTPIDPPPSTPIDPVPPIPIDPPLPTPTDPPIPIPTDPPAPIPTDPSTPDPSDPPVIRIQRQINPDGLRTIHVDEKGWRSLPGL